jgi:outer membrane protein OmpA-like peptidoglycan-associated protein
MVRRLLIPLVVLVLCAGSLLPARAQFRTQGLGGGIGFGLTHGQTDLRDRVGRFIARGFVRYGFDAPVAFELGAGLGRFAGAEYNSEIVPIDARLVLSPFNFETVNPFIYAGAGMMHYYVKEFPPQAPPTQEVEEWVGYAPAGIGIQTVLQENVLFEASGGFNYTFSKQVKGLEVENNDAFWTYMLGITVVGEDPNGDPDGDGLTNREEKQLGTDKKVADSDADGLMDGAEVKQYSTNPLNADSDGEGLTDGDEVRKHMTNPNKSDSDGDGLNDKDELFTFRTDANKADTDGDTLNDGAELNIHKTDPLKADSDGDGLNDGDEVNRHRTNALVADSDGGTVNDGVEVNRGTNPLDRNDDIPKAPPIEIGKAIVLEGIVFASGKADITPESEVPLQKAFESLRDNPDISVEIAGHTDNTGRKASNVTLSQKRADAVKTWFVGKGIDAGRISTRGYGPDRPIAPNTTPEGRQQNRRIEFIRTK